MRSHKLLIVVFLVLLAACTPHAVVTKAPDTPFNVEKLLVLPFRDMPMVYGVNENVRCPVCGTFMMTGELAEGAAGFLTDQLFSLLKDNSDFKLIPPGLARGVHSSLLSDEINSMSERDILVATGRALKADAVMAGYVFRYRERVGTRYSVELPASVAFEIHLIRVADGRVLWSGQFNETQRSLSEDLFDLGTFIKRKAAWITAPEMAQAGLEETLQSLAGFNIQNQNPE